MSEFESYLQKIETVFTKLIKPCPAETAERQTKVSPQAYVLEEASVEALGRLQISDDSGSQPAHTIYIATETDSFHYLAPGMEAVATIAIDKLNMIDLCCMDSLPSYGNLPEGEHSVYVLAKSQKEGSEPVALYCIDRTQSLPVIINLTEHLANFMASELYQRFANRRFHRMFELSKADLVTIEAATAHPLPCVTAPLTLNALKEVRPIVLSLIANDGHIVSQLAFDNFQDRITRKYTRQYDEQAAHIRQETLSLLKGLASDTCGLSPIEKRTIFMSCNEREYSLGQMLLEKADHELVLAYLVALKKIGDAECLRDIVLQNESSESSVSLHQYITSQDSQLIRAYLECLSVCYGTTYLDQILTCQQDDEEVLSMRLSRLGCEQDDDSGKPMLLVSNHLVQLENLARPEGLWGVLCAISMIDANHLGQILAINGSKDDLEAYLDLLERRLQTPDDAEAVRWILMHVNEEGNSLLHLINTYQYHNKSVIKKQFSLLKKLSEILEGAEEKIRVPTKDGEDFEEKTLFLTKEVRFLDCLSVTNQQGLTPGHLIAQRKNPEDIRSYLTLLDAIQDPHLLVLFLQINLSGDNFGHLIAESAFKGQGLENVGFYLDILFKIYDLGDLSNVLLDELANLLRQLNRDGFPFGVMIGRNASSMCRYFDLLTRFEDESVFKEIFFQETHIPDKYQHAKSHRSNHGLTLGHSMTLCDDPDVLPVFIMHVVNHLQSEDIILRFLKNETAGGETFLTLLAKHQGGHEISAIIQRLMAIINLRDFLELIHQENGQGENFLSILIEKHNSIRIQSFLKSMLTEEKKNGVVQFLNDFHFENGQFTLVNLVISHNDPSATKFFIKEILFKIDVNVLSDVMMFLDKKGVPIAHQIITPRAIGDKKPGVQTPGIISFFMSGVLSLLPDMKAKMGLVNLTDINGNTIIHELANQCKGKLIEDVFCVINILIEIIGFNDFLRLIHRVSADERSFLSIMVNHNDQTTIKSFINSMLINEHFKGIVDSLKEPEIEVAVSSSLVKNNRYDVSIDLGFLSLSNVIMMFGNYSQVRSFLENVVFEIHDSKDFLQFMTSCDDAGNPFMHQVMGLKSICDADGCLKHEALIRFMFENVMDCLGKAGDVDTLLSPADNDGNTILHLIAGHANVKLIMDCINLWSVKFDSLMSDSKLKEWRESIESSSNDSALENFELRENSISSIVSFLDHDDDNSLMVNDTDSLCGDVSLSEQHFTDFEIALNIKNKDGKSFKDILEENHGRRIFLNAEGEYGLIKVKSTVELTPVKASSSTLSTLSSSDKTSEKSLKFSLHEKESLRNAHILRFQYK